MAATTGQKVNRYFIAICVAALWFQAFFPTTKGTLADHAGDPRVPQYSLDELEKALTHDDLWNAAQLQVVAEGKMHGFLRMYWAKKILEWTSSPGR